MVHENIVLSKNKGNKAHVLIGTIAAIGSDAEDTPEIGTANVEIDGYDLVENVPIFYHCEDSEIASSGSFRIDDRVIVLNYASAINAKNMRIVGYEDGLPRYCCLWNENWEGETITSNHPWEYLESYSHPDFKPCCSGSGCTQTTISDNKILRARACINGGIGICICWPWVDFNNYPEERLSLGDLSGFKAQIYIAELGPSSHPAYTKCSGPNDDYGYYYNIWICLYVRNKSTGQTKYYNYGWFCHRILRCKDESPYTWYYTASGLSYSELQAKAGTWQDIQFITDYSGSSSTPPPWGNSNYEITHIELICKVLSDKGTDYVEAIVYFDNLCFY